MPDFHPEVRAMLRKRKAMGARPLSEYKAGPEARKEFFEANAFLRHKPEPVAKVEDKRIKGPGGEIPIRIYWAKAKGPMPIVVSFHGGGWVLGSIEEQAECDCMLVNRAGAILVAVDYRLGPEHRFPAAVEDCFAATEWAHRNAASLGGDPKTMVVTGTSAGANLAAVVCLMARDTGSPPIAHQLLVYPITDYTRDMSEFEGVGYGPTPGEMRWFGDNYLAKPSNATNPLVSPLRADLHELPPATIITAKYDTLSPQVSDYARKLRRSGVQVQTREYKGMVHGFFSRPGYYKSSREAIDYAGRRLRKLKASSRSRRTP